MTVWLPIKTYYFKTTGNWSWNHFLDVNISWNVNFPQFVLSQELSKSARLGSSIVHLVSQCYGLELMVIRSKDLQLSRKARKKSNHKTYYSNFTQTYSYSKKWVGTFAFILTWYSTGPKNQVGFLQIWILYFYRFLVYSGLDFHK